jgi:hypothetical protein
VVGRPEHRRRPDHGPLKIRLARQDGLAPALAVEIVELQRGIARERDEVLLACGPAVKVWVDARRHEHVARSLEKARDRTHLTWLIASEVEHHVRLDLPQRALELVVISAVERDVAREGAIGSLLPPRRDGLHAAAHQLLARRYADEASAAEDQGSRH